MRTIQQRLHNINSKVERAKKHIRYLDRDIRRFFKTEPYKVETKRDSQSRKLIYYLVSVDPAPNSLALIAGDAIQNLMTALDHLAYELVGSDTADMHPNPKHIYFPIGKDSVDFETRLNGKMKGILPDTADAIRALKPYKGGNDILWRLHGLNNIEKHRLLLTVGSHSAGIHLGEILASKAKGTQFTPEVIEMMRSMNTFILPADKGFPLQAGFELFIDAVDAEPNPKQKFAFDIALNEPGVIEGNAILETMHQSMCMVEGIVMALTPRLK